MPIRDPKKKRSSQAATGQVDIVAVGKRAEAIASADQPPSISRASAVSRILVADEDTEVGDFVFQVLGNSCAVESIADGKAALAAIRQQRPDLVLASDTFVRRKGGGLLRAIRADPETSTLSVIILSHSAVADTKAGDHELEADDYLSKPLNKRELLLRVGLQLKMAALRNEVAAQNEKLRVHERDSSALTALSREIAALGDDAEIIQIATRLVGTHLGAHRCFFAENDSAGIHVKVSHNWLHNGAPSIEGHHELSEYADETLLCATRSGRLAVEDCTTHPLARRFASRIMALQIQSWASAPFTREGRWVATLTVTEPKPRAWTSAELAFLEHVVERVWPAVERARAVAALRRSETAEVARRTQLEAIMQAAPAAIWIAHDRSCRVVTGNATAGAMLRMRPDANMSKSAAETSTDHFEVFSEGHRVAPGELPVQQAARDGQPVYHRELELRFNDGTSLWEYGSAVPLLDAKGGVTGAVAVFTDITPLKRATDSLRRRSRELELLNHTAATLTAEHDLETIVQQVTDAGREISGAAFGAFFYNVVNERGEAYTLYTISGVPREAFSKFPMPRNTELFGPTFRGEGIVRVGDVRKDPRFGKNPPHHGMPKGHLPVVSYLAVPVKSRTGAVLGGLFFGHAEPDVFTAEAESAVAALAAQASVSIDNANLYTALQTELTRTKEAEIASRRFAELVQSSDDAIIGVTLEGIVTSWNPGAERMFGYSAEEIIGQSVTMLIPEDRTDEEPRILERISRGEHTSHYETVRCRKDGTQLDISLSVSPVKNYEGKIVGASKIARDVTARRRAEAKQQALYDLLATVNRAAALPEIYEAALDTILRCQNADRASILLCDDKNVMRFVAWRDLSDGYRVAVDGHSPWRADDSSPQPISIADVTEAEFDPQLRDVLAREGIRALAFIPLKYEKRLIGKFMIYYNAPHAFESDELRLVEAIATQVAFAIERQKGAQALEALVNERTASLRNAIAQMEEFSYSVSHDLRSPVRAMRGYAGALLEDYGDKLDDDGRELLARIQRNGLRMDRLIQDLLTYSRISRQDLRLEPVSLDKLVRDVILHYPEMGSDKADIEIISPLPDVIAHEPSLTQAISNLLSNAVKFVAPGTRAQVRVHGENRGAYARLWVADNGIGIPPEYHRRLFGMFERMHPDYNYDGMGIGLAIVRKAVERMNGSVGVHSDGIKGSQFWIELPAKDAT